MSVRCTGDTNTPDAPLILQGQLKEGSFGPSSGGHNPGLDSSVPTVMKQTEFQSCLGLNSQVVHRVHAGGSEKPSDEAVTTFHDLPGSAQQSDFETTFKMVIHTGRADPQIALRIGKLDTASDVDAVSEDVVTSLGMTMGRYAGPPILPLGPPIKPVGEIQLEWHIATREKTYTTRFAVLKNKHSRGFDVLLGRQTIKNIRFYDKNRNVWFSGTGSVILVTPGRQDSDDDDLSITST